MSLCVYSVQLTVNSIHAATVYDRIHDFELPTKQTFKMLLLFSLSII